MKLENKARFWTGAVMGLFELLGLTIFGLTLVNWSWLTERMLLIIFIVFAIVIYNFLAGMLIWNGSMKKKKDESDGKKRKRK